MYYTHTAAALTHAPEIVLDIGCNRCHRRYHCRRRRCRHCRHTEQISNIQIFAVPAFPMNWLWLGLGTADKGIEIVATTHSQHVHSVWCTNNRWYGSTATIECIQDGNAQSLFLSSFVSFLFFWRFQCDDKGEPFTFVCLSVQLQKSIDTFATLLALRNSSDFH